MGCWGETRIRKAESERIDWETRRNGDEENRGSGYQDIRRVWHISDARER